MAHIPSTFQVNIYNFIQHGIGNAVIEAVAGSGKTHTIVEAIKLILGIPCIFLAFNRDIAQELKARGLNASTFHAMCFSPVLRFTGAHEVTKTKLRLLVDKHFTGDDAVMYGQFMLKLVGLARQAGIGCLVPDVESEWMALVEHHDMELENERANMRDALYYSRKLLEYSNASKMVDFDDLLYLAVKEGISLPKYPYIFVDEGQDTNAIQRAILRKIMLPDSRLFVVGDPAQAIYGFRGADSNSLALIAQEFNCTTLPLSVSYRCATDIVAYAQQWVSHIQPAPNAPKGEVIHMGAKWSVADFAINDLVVCRTTQPLVALGYKMLKARIPVQILGKDIGEGLINLIKKMKAQGIDRLVEKLSIWRNREVEKANAKKQDDKAMSIGDKADAILCLIDGLSEQERTIPALIGVISTLFNDAKNVIRLGTIHRCKGLEAVKVFWLNSSKCPAQWARQPWQQEQERSLCYVATTRAKMTLVLIEDKDKEQEGGKVK